MEQLAERPGGWKKRDSSILTYLIICLFFFNNSLFSSGTQYIVDFLLHRESFRSLRSLLYIFFLCHGEGAGASLHRSKGRAHPSKHHHAIAAS